MEMFDLKKIHIVLKKKFGVSWNRIESIGMRPPLVLRILNCEMFRIRNKVYISGVGDGVPICLYLTFLFYNNNEDRIYSCTCDQIKINSNNYLNFIETFCNQDFIVFEFFNEDDAIDSFATYYLVDDKHDSERYLNIEVSRW